MENLQLGRLDEALQHYLVLQGNLVALASELDNYPIEELDPFSDLDKFPDAFMRKDCLDDMLPFEERALPRPPILPPCVDCARHQVGILPQANICPLPKCVPRHSHFSGLQFGVRWRIPFPPR